MQLKPFDPTYKQFVLGPLFASRVRGGWVVHLWFGTRVFGIAKPRGRFLPSCYIDDLRKGA